MDKDFSKLLSDLCKIVAKSIAILLIILAASLMSIFVISLIIYILSAVGIMDTDIGALSNLLEGFSIGFVAIFCAGAFGFVVSLFASL